MLKVLLTASSTTLLPFAALIRSLRTTTVHQAPTHHIYMAFTSSWPNILVRPPLSVFMATGQLGFTRMGRQGRYTKVGCMTPYEFSRFNLNGPKTAPKNLGSVEQLPSVVYLNPYLHLFSRRSVPDKRHYQRQILLPCCTWYGFAFRPFCYLNHFFYRRYWGDV